jgi:hypothetical protein
MPDGSKVLHRSVADASRMFSKVGSCRGAIFDNLYGRRKTAYGYKWEYANVVNPSPQPEPKESELKDKVEKVQKALDEIMVKAIEALEPKDEMIRISRKVAEEWLEDIIGFDGKCLETDEKLSNAIRNALKEKESKDENIQ